MSEGAARVAVVQHDIVWEEAEVTRTRLVPLVESAVEAGATVVVLTEMFASGFSAHTEVIAEPRDGPTVTWMRDLADRLRIWIVGSVCELPTGAASVAEALPSNVAVVAGPAGSVDRYAKRHLFSYAGEHERIAPGHDRLDVLVDGLRVAVLVCYDLRFAPEFWDRAERTDCYVVVANWPAARRSHWRALLVARAIENQAWVVGANRVGAGGSIDYVGDSLVVDPLGKVVADGEGGEEVVLVAEVSAARVAEVRARYPFLADR